MTNTQTQPSSTTTVSPQPDRDAIALILESICTALGWEHGALWQVDPHLQRLRCIEVWTAPGARLEQFKTLSRQTMFARGVAQNQLRAFQRVALHGMAQPDHFVIETSARLCAGQCAVYYGRSGPQPASFMSFSSVSETTERSATVEIGDDNPRRSLQKVRGNSSDTNQTV